MVTKQTSLRTMLENNSIGLLLRQRLRLMNTIGNRLALILAVLSLGPNILSEGAHRLNHVESWAGDLLITLEKCLAKSVRSLDFTEDRLAIVLDSLGQDDDFEAFEGNLNQGIIRVYDLRTKRVRVDSTSASGYMTVTENGLFQFGHS